MKCDLVLVKYGASYNYLFQAPYICGLKKGDLVEVEGGSKYATVVDVISLGSYGEETYKFITQMQGVTMPLKKVIAKVRLEKYSYEEGINE